MTPLTLGRNGFTAYFDGYNAAMMGYTLSDHISIMNAQREMLKRGKVFELYDFMAGQQAYRNQEEKAGNGYLI
jgi:hypothetical protein